MSDLQHMIFIGGPMHGQERWSLTDDDYREYANGGDSVDASCYTRREFEYRRGPIAIRGEAWVWDEAQGEHATALAALRVVVDVLTREGAGRE